VFVGLSFDQWCLAEMLRRMAGVADGIRCDLTHDLTPVTGGYYVVPSVEALAPLAPPATEQRRRDSRGFKTAAADADT